MPVSKIDERTALIVVDLQKGIAAMPTVPYPVAEVIERTAQLAKAFRARGLPVVLVNVTGGAPGRTESPPPRLANLPADWADLVPELDRQPSDHVVTKLQWGAFTGTSLDQYLRRQGVTQVVLTGVATSVGVESTARHAHELGYNVTLIVDAMADRLAESHQHSVGVIFPRLGETTTTADLLRLL
jgi:nicotinamidase-related amidase